jgi:hypothetical protein
LHAAYGLSPLRSRRADRKTCQNLGPHQQGCYSLASLPGSALRADLHPDSVGIEHVEACEVALERLDATFREIAHGRFLIVARDPNREMVHRSDGFFEIERDQRAGIAEPKDIAGIAEPKDITCRFPLTSLKPNIF